MLALQGCSKLVWAAILLAALSAGRGARAADPAKTAPQKSAPADGSKVTGILIDLKADWITVKADGEDEPVKYLIDVTDKKVVADRSGVLIPHRVQLTYSPKGEARQLASIKAQRAGKPAGTVTGEVVKNYGWWVEIKPKTGVADGYALNYGEKNKDLIAQFNELKAGDPVTIKYATDAERHRIQTIHKPASSAHKAGTPSAADHAVPGAVKVAGILIDRKDDWITVKADGEDEPVKYAVDKADQKLTTAFRGIFNASRVQLSYKPAGDARQLASIKRQILKPSGTVTGEVVKVYNDFWVEVKPAKGLADAYAPGANFNDKEFMSTLRGLKPGDSVTIVFTTDFERHRITSLRKNTPAAAKK